MTKITLEDMLNEIGTNELNDRDKKRTISIVVASEGLMGGTPTVEVKQASLGFDFDSQKVLIFPEQPLTALTPENLEDISKSVNDSHSFHTRQLLKEGHEREKKLHQFLKDLDQSTMTSEQKEYISQLW